MSIKKLENGCLWSKEVYIVRSKPLKPINPKHKMGTWCGYNIILTEDRFGKISKGSINKLKNRIRKKLKGLNPLTSSELEKRNEELLKVIVESVSLEFLNQTIKPLIFKRLGVTLNIDVNKLKTMPYKEYLKTDHWKKVDGDAKKRADYKCQLCGYDKYLNVHHNDYSRKGEELPSDLVVLCKTCHAKFHDKL